MLCKTCLVDKLESEFHPSVSYKCKECLNVYAREWRKRFPDKAAAKEAAKRERYRDKIRVARKLYYQAHGEKRPANYLEVNKRWVAAHRKERNASARLQYAVKSGLVLRPKHCDACGTDCTPHGHHYDYNRVLDVIWLCASCHRDNHSIHHRPVKVRVAELVALKFPSISNPSAACPVSASCP